MINKELLKRIELVVFDLDGTLTDDRDNISPQIISLIKKLKNKGVKFSIATGRLHSAVLEHAKKIEIDIPLITLDGTLIKNPATDEIIFESSVPKKYVKRALELSDKFLLKIALCNADAIFYTEENSLIPTLLEKNGAPFSLVESYNNSLDNILEIVITGEYSENIKYVSNKMSFPYTFGIQTTHYRSQSHGGVYYIEIRKIGSDKGDGLRKLCRHLAIKEKNTAVMGDWYNDKSLFETEALKIAMANAVPEIKKLADMVTKKSNNEEGSAEFLKLLLEAKS